MWTTLVMGNIYRRPNRIFSHWISERFKQFIRAKIEKSFWKLFKNLRYPPVDERRTSSFKKLQEFYEKIFFPKFVARTLSFIKWGGSSRCSFGPNSGGDDISHNLEGLICVCNGAAHASCFSDQFWTHMTLLLVDFSTRDIVTLKWLFWSIATLSAWLIGWKLSLLVNIAG